MHLKHTDLKPKYQKVKMLKFFSKTPELKNMPKADDISKFHTPQL